MKLDIEGMIQYCITPLPFSTATADGFLLKTDKSRTYHYITTNVDNTPLPQGNILTIEDGNAFFSISVIYPSTLDKYVKRSTIFFSKKGDTIRTYPWKIPSKL